MTDAPRPPSPRDHLVAVALALLDEHHPEDLSLREVARQAGLTSGAPAHHFGNKVGLLAACAEVATAELHAHMAAAPTGESARADIEAIALAYTRWALARPGIYRLVFSRLFEDASQFPDIAAWRSRCMDLLIERVETELGGVQAPGVVGRRTFAVWSLLHGQVTITLDGLITPAKAASMHGEVCRMAALLALPDPEA